MKTLRFALIAIILAVICADTARTQIVSGGGINRLVAGSNISLTPASGIGDAITITATAGGTGCTVAGSSGDLQKNNGGAGCAAASLNDNGTTVAATEYFTATNLAAPASPASGKDAWFSDSTDLRFHDKNASGVTGTTVVADTGATHNFLKGISAAGAITKGQPACGDLSDAVSTCNSLNNITFTGKTIFASTQGTVTTDTDGSTITFDLSASNIHSVQLGGNRTLAISNGTVGQVFTIILIQPASAGPDTVTWFTTIKWAGGSAPTLTTTNSKADMFTCMIYSSANYYCTVAGQNF